MSIDLVCLVHCTIIIPSNYIYTGILHVSIVVYNSDHWIDCVVSMAACVRGFMCLYSFFSASIWKKCLISSAFSFARRYGFDSIVFNSLDEYWVSVFSCIVGVFRYIHAAIRAFRHRIKCDKYTLRLFATKWVGGAALLLADDEVICTCIELVVVRCSVKLLLYDY